MRTEGYMIGKVVGENRFEVAYNSETPPRERVENVEDRWEEPFHADTIHCKTEKQYWDARAAIDGFVTRLNTGEARSLLFDNLDMALKKLGVYQEDPKPAGE